MVDDPSRLDIRLIGYFWAPTRSWERGVLLLGAVLLIFPGALSDMLGLGGLVAVWLAQRARQAIAAPVASLE